MRSLTWCLARQSQGIDFHRLQTAFRASVHPSPAAPEPLPPPQPVRAVTALPDLDPTERQRLRLLGYQLIAEVLHSNPLTQTLPLTLTQTQTPTR